MSSRPKTRNRKRIRATGHRKPATGNRPRKTRCRLCGERESVSVRKEDILFVGPAVPAPPFEPPRPKAVFSVPSFQFRSGNKHKRQNTRLRDLEPAMPKPVASRPSRPGIPRSQHILPRPVASKTRDRRPETGHRQPATEISRGNFLREAGFGGALFAAAVALGKPKKRKKR